MIVSLSLVPHFDTERQMLRFVYTLTQSHLRNGGVRRIFPLFVIRIPLHLGSSYLNITRVLLLKLFLCCSLCNGIFFCNFRGNDLLLYIYLRELLLYHEFFALSLISAPNVFFFKRFSLELTMVATCIGRFDISLGKLIWKNSQPCWFILTIFSLV